MSEPTRKSRRTVRKPTGKRKPSQGRTKPYDSNFRWLSNFPKSLWELLRLSLAAVVYRNLDRRFALRLIPTRVEGGDGLIDEGDMCLVVKHRDGRTVVNVLEHKSDKTKYALLQVISSAFRLARQLVEDGETTGGEMPIINAVLALNGKASRSRPKDLAELAKLTPEEKAATLTAEKVNILDVGDIRREHLSKNEAVGAPILIVRAGQKGPPLDDEDLAYVARGLKDYTKNKRQYALHALVIEQGVSVTRLKKAMASVGDPRVTEEIMDMSFEMVHAKGEARGEAKGKVDAFLMMARSKFRRVPRNIQAQVRAASMPQLDNWLRRIPTAPSLNAVFDGDGHAVNGAPVKSP